jgi:hypothetical protein
MNNEISESAKAVQEVAKTTNVAIEATKQLGGFVSRIIDEPLEAVVGILADRLKFIRAERQFRLVDRWGQIMQERKIGPTLRIVPPKLALPIIENASIEENDELQDLWANLLASAVDPNFKGILRSAYIDIIKQLEVNDVHVLNFIYSKYKENNLTYREGLKLNPRSNTDAYADPNKVPVLMRHILASTKIGSQEYKESVDNLIRVRCIASHIEDEQIRTEVEGKLIAKTVRFTHIYNLVCMTPLGISFAEACTGQVS